MNKKDLDLHRFKTEKLQSEEIDQKHTAKDTVKPRLIIKGN